MAVLVGQHTSLTKLHYQGSTAAVTNVHTSYAANIIKN
jgi:hypothetical protein